GGERGEREEVGEGREGRKERAAGHRPAWRSFQPPHPSRRSRRSRRSRLLDPPLTRGYVTVLPQRHPRAGQYHGGVAQLGERVNGIHEVRGSIPLASIASGWRGTLSTGSPVALVWSGR